jgi:hypothetical protein
MDKVDKVSHCINNDFQGYKGFQIKIKQIFFSKLD